MPHINIKQIGFAFALAAAGMLNAATITLTSFNYPGSTNTTAYAINNAGQIGGAASVGSSVVGYIYSGGVFTENSFPNSIFSTVTDLNDNGLSIGYYEGGTVYNSSGPYTGYIDNNGVYTSTSVPGATSTQNFGINNSGEVVGEYYKSNVSHGFLLNGGVFTSIDVPGSSFTNAYAINDNGEIVGFYRVSGGAFQAFSLSNGVYTTLKAPGSTATLATGINNLGQITGSATVGGVSYGFLFSGGTYTLFGSPGANATNGYKINDEGEIVGTFNATSTSGHTSYYTNQTDAGTVPEPGTLLSAFGALGAIALVARKRRASK